MEQKTAKMFLPSSYEQFLQQKKKVGKSIIIQKTSIMPEETRQAKQGAVQHRTEHEDENEAPSKPGKIIEKVVHSDFKRMFD